MRITARRTAAPAVWAGQMTTVGCAVLFAGVLAILAGSLSPARASEPAGGAATPLDRQLEYGITLALSGRLAAADSVFISVLSSSPGDPRALAGLGNLSLMRGDPELAMAFYDRAGRADTADAGIRLNRSVALLLAGDSDGAREEARRALQQAGGSGPARGLLGLRGEDRGPNAGKGAGQPALTREELLALLAAAADSVPADSTDGVADSLATPSRERPAKGHPPTWRSAGPRAVERIDLAPMRYWKRSEACMRPQGTKGRRLQVRQGVLLSLGCLLALVALDRAGIFAAANLKLTDLRFRLRGERPVTDRLALIEVDDAAIRVYGRWPLPREAYALLIAAAERGGARAVGMDLLFLSRDPESTRSDDLLVATTALNPRVVHAMAFLPAAPGAGMDESHSPEWWAALERHGLSDAAIPATRARSVSAPFDDLLEAAGAVGHVSVAVDRDGGVRRVPMIVRYGDRLYPALGLRLAGMAAGDSALPEVRPARGGFEVIWPGGRTQFIPTDGEGGTALDFAGDRAAVPQAYPMLSVLRWYRQGDTARLKQVFDGRVVLVGTTAINQVVSDVGTTPFATTTPLVFIHANVINSVLQNRFLRPPPEAAYLAALVALSLLLGWLYVALALPVAAAVMAGAVLACGAVIHILFVRWALDVRPLLVLLLPAVGYAAVASYRFIFLERKTRERERELDMARAIQQRLLPLEPPDLPELDVHGLNVPAQEIGGDYFDWFPLGPDQWAFVIGDVSGKGISAALLMSHLHALLHTEVRENHRPGAVLASVSESLYRATDTQRFATFFLVVIRPGGGPLLYGNAGHNPPLLVHGGREMEALGPTGVPLGMFEEAVYEEEARPFEPGDTLVMFSDGVTECVHRGELYGEERLEKLVAGLAARRASAREIGEAILEDTRSFCRGGPWSDDLTVLVVRRR